MERTFRPSAETWLFRSIRPLVPAAIERHFQGAAWQRCYVHFLRNAGGEVTRKHRKVLTSFLKAVYAAPDRAWALELAWYVVESWSETHPAFSRWIEDGIEATLAHFSFPEAHRRKIRSTNGLERFNQDIKRRTRVVRIYRNRDACLRLVTALCVERSEEWLSGKQHLDMSQLEPSEDAASGAIRATEDDEDDIAA